MDSLAIPKLASFVRLQTDRISGDVMLLGPEVALQLTPSAGEILRRCDGTRSIDQVAVDLSSEFDVPADQMRADVTQFLERLGERGYVTWSAP